MFDTIQEYLGAVATLDPEVAEEELKKFSKTERMNIMQTTYLSRDLYPQKRYNSNLVKLSIQLGNKAYYPVMWSPDANDLKWLNKLPVRTLHNSKENRSYRLLG